MRFTKNLVVLGDTFDTSIYRDTKISRYWYRVCFDTFWYRDTKSIAILFSILVFDTTQVANRAFSVAGLVVWNSLPAAVREADSLYSFKRMLKTHLFNLCFTD